MASSVNQHDKSLRYRLRFTLLIPGSRARDTLSPRNGDREQSNENSPEGQKRHNHFSLGRNLVRKQDHWHDYAADTAHEIAPETDTDPPPHVHEHKTSTLADIIRHLHETEKPIFTICHGVQVLIAVDGVVKGRRVAALQYCEPEVRLAGGIYVDVEPTGACADGNLVSAKGWPGLAAFMRECLKVLGTEIHHGETLKGRERKAA
jgi:hypothetical protein